MCERLRIHLCERLRTHLCESGLRVHLRESGLRTHLRENGLHHTDVRARHHSTRHHPLTMRHIASDHSGRRKHTEGRLSLHHMLSTDHLLDGSCLTVAQMVRIGRSRSAESGETHTPHETLDMMENTDSD